MGHGPVELALLRKEEFDARKEGRAVRPAAEVLDARKLKALNAEERGMLDAQGRAL